MRIETCYIDAFSYVLNHSRKGVRIETLSLGFRLASRITPARECVLKQMSFSVFTESANHSRKGVRIETIHQTISLTSSRITPARECVLKQVTKKNKIGVDRITPARECVLKSQPLPDFPDVRNHSRKGVRIEIETIQILLST